jgi:hypothetical protein
MLQTIAAMKLEAGVMADGVAEALADEEVEVVQLLAALPTHRLPQQIQLQLSTLGVSQARLERGSAAEDFELPGLGLDECGLQAGGTASDLAELAPYLDSSRELTYVLEHREELAAAASGAEEGHGAELLSTSSSKSARGQFGDDAEGVGLEHMLQLDQEIELLPGSAAAPGSSAGTADGDSGKAGLAAGWSGRGQPGMQWAAGSAAGGKVTVLSQLKASRQSMLPPSNKPLGRNTGVKPQMQVR